jgi:hypothetical protein
MNSTAYRGLNACFITVASNIPSILKLRSSPAGSLDQHTKNRTTPAKDAIKIFIIANRKDIQKTLDHGYDRKAIWETMKKNGQINCSYPRFCQKLKQYLSPKVNG